MLTGADVVVSTAGVGGRRAWEADVFIPRKYILSPIDNITVAAPRTWHNFEILKDEWHRYW